MSPDPTPTFFTGGCTRGAIRYECTAEPIAMFNCHCRDCQRASGGLYIAVVYVPVKSFKITKGTPCFYDTPSEAMGHNKRAFCAKCGSRLFGGITDEGQGITRFKPGRSELVSSPVRHLHFGRSAMGLH